MADSDMAESGLVAPPTLRSLFARSEFPNRFIVAGTFSVGAFLYGIGYIVAVEGGFGAEYLVSTSVYFVLLGSLAGLFVLLWGGWYHLRVWENVRRCFDVSNRQYDEKLEPLLDRAYSQRAIAGEFAIALILGVLADRAFGIPYAIVIDTPRTCLTTVGGLCVDYLSVINYLYGIVFLLVVVTVIHAIVFFLLTVRRMTELPVTDVETAAERLEPIVHFSIFVAVSLFVGTALVSIVYRRLMTAFGTGEVPPHVLVVTLVVAALLFVGLAVFWIPQMAVHGIIVAGKQDRLTEISEEYERLLAKCRAEEGAADRLSTELAILDARRRNAKEIKTWSYNIPSLLPLLGSAAASAIVWFVELAQRVGL